jgi:ribosomal protein L40E
VSVNICCCSLPSILLLALPVYVAVISYASSHTLPPDDPMARRFPDFSPMPLEFEDFAWRLEQAKQINATLICYECGHHNPVGLSQCQECGAWVPQTAKARWACGPRRR